MELKNLNESTSCYKINYINRYLKIYRLWLENINNTYGYRFEGQIGEMEYILQEFFGLKYDDIKKLKNKTFGDVFKC